MVVVEDAAIVVVDTRPWAIIKGRKSEDMIQDFGWEEMEGESGGFGVWHGESVEETRELGVWYVSGVRFQRRRWICNGEPQSVG